MRSPLFLGAAATALVVAAITAAPHGVGALAAGADSVVARHLVSPSANGPVPTSGGQTVTGGVVGIPPDLSSWPTSTWDPGGTWYNTWAANSDIYATSDDSGGFDNNICVQRNGHGGNFVVNELAGDNPGALSASYTNLMTGCAA